MSEEKKSFTVKDRRHFTAEGLTAVNGHPRRRRLLRPLPRSMRCRGRGARQGRRRRRASPVDFAGFLLSLAAQASLTLEPAEGAGQGRLDAAAISSPCSRC